MKCKNCGNELTQALLDNISTISDRVIELGDTMGVVDIAILSDELEISDRQVRKYVKIVESIGQAEFLERVKNGESINSLLETTNKRKKSSIYKGYKAIANEYEIDFIEFRELLKKYKKGGDSNE